MIALTVGLKHGSLNITLTLDQRPDAPSRKTVDGVSGPLALAFSRGWVHSQGPREFYSHWNRP
jgi:hypothetical protein